MDKNLGGLEEMIAMLRTQKVGKLLKAAGSFKASYRFKPTVKLEMAVYGASTTRKIPCKADCCSLYFYLSYQFPEVGISIPTLQIKKLRLTTNQLLAYISISLGFTITSLPLTF